MQSADLPFTCRWMIKLIRRIQQISFIIVDTAVSTALEPTHHGAIMEQLINSLSRLPFFNPLKQLNCPNINVADCCVPSHMWQRSLCYSYKFAISQAQRLINRPCYCSKDAQFSYLSSQSCSSSSTPGLRGLLF